ncbi:hypothetical protein [Pseudomonas phage KP1]|uniref:Uncharacterized protein n=1 Tax=Pseudomonas phage KP1 TaxID=2562463 RepID=A0A6G5QAK6_9CAUD|nr:hypothetical protein PM391_gp10 [Pseudomonas phage KP1]QBZ71725.1 hypothetical protein [Pseudomonas phage KP1]
MNIGANAMKPARILYFVNGPAPSPEDYQAASDLNANVVFRNALAVPGEPHCLEMCDGVAGEVPPLYSEAYPDAEEAIAKKSEELKALSARVGDEPAPRLTAAQRKAAEKAAKLAAKQTGQGGGTGTWNPNAPT